MSGVITLKPMSGYSSYRSSMIRLRGMRGFGGYGADLTDRVSDTVRDRVGIEKGSMGLKPPDQTTEIADQANAGSDAIVDESVQSVVDDAGVGQETSAGQETDLEDGDTTGDVSANNLTNGTDTTAGNGVAQPGFVSRYKWWLIGGGAAAVLGGIVAVLAWRKKKRGY